MNSVFFLRALAACNFLRKLKFRLSYAAGKPAIHSCSVQRAAKIRGRMQRLKSKTCRNSSQTITLQAFKRLRKCAESENPNLQQAQKLHLDKRWS